MYITFKAQFFIELELQRFYFHTLFPFLIHFSSPFASCGVWYETI